MKSNKDDCLSFSSHSNPSFGEEKVDGTETNLNNYRYTNIVLQLFDPSFFEDQTIVYDPTQPLPVPEITHELYLRREFSEDEKEDIWRGLELLRQLNQLDPQQQTEIHVQKAIDTGIYVFDIAYVKGDKK